MEQRRNNKQFKEHNNRQKANKLAEYITGDNLRKYCRDKINEYVKGAISVFDGAVGSGQLEQYLDARHIYGVDVQNESLEALAENYDNVTSYHMSFFEFDEDIEADVTLMNPPFSLEYKSLSEKEKINIAMDFPWKKSGKLDDIFVLKGLKYSKKYGFFIIFPGVAYRKTELRFRREVGNNLVEINEIRNAFEDTNISVLFLVIDKEKEIDDVKSSIFDCKLNKLIYEESIKINPDKWDYAREPVEKEVVDIDLVERELNEIDIKSFENKLETRLFLYETFGKDNGIENFINALIEIAEKFKRRYENARKAKTQSTAD